MIFVDVCRFGSTPDDCFFSQRDVESVKFCCSCTIQYYLSSLGQHVGIRMFSLQESLGNLVPPWLVSNSTQCYSCFYNCISIHFKRTGHRYKSKRKGSPVADL